MTAQRNPPVDIGPSSPSDDCANNRVGMTNESARESGSLQVIIKKVPLIFLLYWLLKETVNSLPVLRRFRQ
ncbi:hypothetical protein T09_968 [Trichinella sp. T9]|nr:hypothetical protein T09_968 [Trichinella sp. T9]